MPRVFNIVMPLIVLLGIGLAVLALSAMPVSSNVLPVDPATGRTEQVPVVETGDAAASTRSPVILRSRSSSPCGRRAPRG